MSILSKRNPVEVTVRREASGFMAARATVKGSAFAGVSADPDWFAAEDAALADLWKSLRIGKIRPSFLRVSRVTGRTTYFTGR